MDTDRNGQMGGALPGAVREVEYTIYIPVVMETEESGRQTQEQGRPGMANTE